MGIHDVDRNSTSYTVNNNIKMLRVDLFQSINGAKLLALNKIVAYYKYLDDGISDNELALLNVYGLTHNNGIKLLCSKVILRCVKDVSNVNISEWTNTIINIDSKGCTGIIAEIEGIEKLQKIEFDGVFKRLLIPLTPVMSQSYSNITLVSFSINDGSPTTTSFNLTLNNVCSSTPTHYRYASSEAGLLLSSWKTYSSNIVVRGVRDLNYVYFQVKDATSESNILSSFIVILYPSDKNEPTNGNLMYLTNLITPSNDKTNGNLMYLTDFIEE